MDEKKFSPKQNQMMSLMDDGTRNKRLKQMLNDALHRLQSTIAVKLKLTFEKKTLEEMASYHIGQMNVNSRNDPETTLQSIVDEIIQLEEKFSSGLQSDTANSDRSERSSVVMMNIGGDVGNVHVEDPLSGQRQINVSVDNNNNEATSMIIDSTSTLLDHQCRHYWQFWFWKSDQRYFEWDSGLQKLAKPFSNKEKLSKLFGQLIDIADVVIPSDYSLFREPIRPKWEDSCNRNGGSWMVEFDRSNTNSMMIQDIWEKLIQMVIERHCDGKHFQHICGLKISMRKINYTISLWIDSFINLRTILIIGIEMQKTIANVIKEKRSKYGLIDGDEKDTEGNNKRPCSMMFIAHKVSENNAAHKERTKFGYIISPELF